MFRVVLDTNTLVSAAIASGNEAKLLLLAHKGVFKIVISIEILKELKDVLSRPKFGFSKEKVELFLGHVIETADIIVIKTKLNLVKADPDDDKILECAVDGGADYIVSGDKKHLLSLGKVRHIPIIRSSEFLRILGKQS